MNIAMPLLKQYYGTQPEDFFLASFHWFPIFKILMMRSGNIYFHNFKASTGINIFELCDLKCKSSPGIIFV